MNEMQLFNYQGKQEVRTIKKGEEVWFVGCDVCNILEIDASTSINGRWRTDTDGVKYRTEGLDDDEKGTAIVSTLGGEQEVLIINEAGLYSLVFKSQKPEAKTFKRWITHEVIPSIRKTGGYGNVEPQISNDLALKIAREKRLTERLAIDSKRVDLERAKFLAELLEKQSSKLPPSSTQRAMSEISGLVMGKQVIDLPMLETKHYSLLEILKEFEKETGILLSKQKAGRLLKKYNLQVPGSGNGEFFKDKSQSSEKEVSSWKYSEMGKQRVIEILKSEFLK